MSGPYLCLQLECMQIIYYLLICELDILHENRGFTEKSLLLWLKNRLPQAIAVRIKTACKS